MFAPTDCNIASSSVSKLESVSPIYITKITICFSLVQWLVLAE